jgi:two-component system sensor histidine kinase CpxA
MVRLVLKIFLAYWLAAGVVIAISDFEPHRHIHNPELVDAVDGALAMSSRMLMDSYEKGRCADVQQAMTTSRDALYLLNSDGTLLCGTRNLPDTGMLVAETIRSGKRTTSNHALYQLIAVPMMSNTNSKYVVVFKNSYGTALQIYGLLPGYTTIAISGVVTLFLAILVALPIRRLRKAAKDISEGKLATRVQWGTLSSRVYGLRDGDDIDRLVRDFNHMAERLQSLAEAQRLLLRDASHELRSPLARMSVALALARTNTPVSTHSHLDRIETEASRLNYLIGQILSLSHIETLQKLDGPRVISLSELVVDLIPDVQYEAAQTNSLIQTTISEGCYIKCDVELVRSAIENILRNAIRYTPANGFIHVETANITAQEERTAVVRVIDNGPGIPEEELRSVLDPFYRADKARHWQQDGFGIGLAIADRAAKLHGGSIQVRNNPQGGLCVEMHFPFADVSSADDCENRREAVSL